MNETINVPYSQVVHRPLTKKQEITQNESQYKATDVLNHRKSCLWLFANTSLKKFISMHIYKIQVHSNILFFDILQFLRTSTLFLFISVVFFFVWLLFALAFCLFICCLLFCHDILLLHEQSYWLSLSSVLATFGKQYHAHTYQQPFSFCDLQLLPWSSASRLLLEFETSFFYCIYSWDLMSAL